ncbi:MAG: AbrB/MazE/SpoVT family DNA-binding domain-containing protein [Solirubrobacterales bacterium]
MTHRVGTKGQVVIPKAIRDEIGIKPGDQVVFEADGTEVRVRRVSDDPRARRARIESLRGTWAGIPRLGTEELLAERRGDRKREERRARRLLDGRP